MEDIDWAQACNSIKPYIVKIPIPEGHGTGFLIAHSGSGALCGIATAEHVVAHAHYWKQPIRLHHLSTKKEVFLTDEDRVVLADEKNDVASVVFKTNSLPLPSELHPLIPETKMVKTGVEVGWMGFPAIAQKELCFFSGRVSAWVSSEKSYLIDGVAINGVSGGPVFHLTQDKKAILIGVVSAYIPNRATGVALPGLCVVRDVGAFQSWIKELKDIGTAKKEETPPSLPPPITPPTAGV